jgi:hypothetical protein
MSRRRRRRRRRRVLLRRVLSLVAGRVLQHFKNLRSRSARTWGRLATATVNHQSSKKLNTGDQRQELEHRRPSRIGRKMKSKRSRKKKWSRAESTEGTKPLAADERTRPFGLPTWRAASSYRGRWSDLTHDVGADGWLSFSYCTTQQAPTRTSRPVPGMGSRVATVHVSTPQRPSQIESRCQVRLGSGYNFGFGSLLGVEEK